MRKLILALFACALFLTPNAFAFVPDDGGSGGGWSHCYYMVDTQSWLCY